MTTTASSLPVAEVLSVTPTRTTRLVTIRCPICHCKHQHGWPYSLDTIGTRVAHCVGRNVPPGAPGSYFIPAPIGNPHRSNQQTTKKEMTDENPDHPHRREVAHTSPQSPCPRPAVCAPGMRAADPNPLLPRPPHHRTTDTEEIP